MPTFEYSCEKCSVLFEEILFQSSDIKKYKEWYPCPQCGERASREKISMVNFSFKSPAGRTQGTGVHGQSGVHDLDYPKLDKAVGRSADVKWKHYNARKERRDKARKEVGSNLITTLPDGTVKAVNPSAAKLREKAISTYNKVRKSSEER